MVKEETVACVKNLKSLNGQKKIIIVDNCSLNGSGKELKDFYMGDSNIIVILEDKNLGFARGNNIGCELAKKMFDPDFYVVMNNDVEITQGDFIQQIEKIADQEHFDVLGPDIYSTTGKVHQSPKSLENMTLEKARRLKGQYDRKLKSRITVPLRCYLKQIKALRLLYNKNKSSQLQIDYTKKYYNVPLHGSCLIFSKSFMAQREQAFFSGTFLYFESEILDYECQRDGLKEVYDPSIKVFHHQNVSTNVVYSHVLKKVKFMNEQNYASISAFLKAQKRNKKYEECTKDISVSFTTIPFLSRK